jgi:hypothetical protein
MRKAIPWKTRSIELPVLRVAPSRPTPLDTGERDRLIRRAKALSWLSLACMTAEGAIGITAAVRAGSVALLGFGLDSGIEALASIIVIGNGLSAAVSGRLRLATAGTHWGIGGAALVRGGGFATVRLCVGVTALLWFAGADERRGGVLVDLVG